MSHPITLYDVRATIKALGRAVAVHHRSPVGEEARAFMLTGNETDVRRVAAMLISGTGTFLQVGRFEVVDGGPLNGICCVAVVLAPDQEGVIRTDGPSERDMGLALYQIAQTTTPDEPVGRIARAALHLPESFIS